jgi:hypothetical protein
MSLAGLMPRVSTARTHTVMIGEHSHVPDDQEGGQEARWARAVGFLAGAC